MTTKYMSEEWELTYQKVENILKYHGLDGNSRDIKDYERAKQIIFGDYWKWIRSAGEYDQIIKWIVDYLQV